MTSLSHRVLASGPGWSVNDLVCAAGPRDPPFEERHDAFCIATVLAGTFRYRSARGAGALAPGAILLGNADECFECGHEHGVGDRCRSFHFSPEYLEEIAADLTGVRRLNFARPVLPPSLDMLPLLAAAECGGGSLEETALRLAGAVLRKLAGAAGPARAPTRRGERRVHEAIRRIEAAAAQRWTLAELARGAGMSPFHFLRTFRQVAGITPHQFVLRTRLQRAAVRLRRSRESVSAIAWEAGFEDLSTFNRRFRDILGQTPRSYRAGGSPPVSL